MGISQTTSAIMVFLTGLLPASCQKTADTKHQPHPPAAAVASAGTNQPAGGKSDGGKSLQRDLGELALTNKNDFCVQFDNGEFCTLTPKLLDRNSVRITLTVESRNTNGETSDFTVKQVITKPGKPLEIAIGDLNLVFTPKIIDGE